MDPNELLRRHFGFDDFRPGQRAVVDALLAGRSALAVFPTGGGKSLCYQLPALTFDGVTLVVSPLIALMKDQIDFLRARGIPAARLDSSVSLDEHRAIDAALAAGTLKLLYVAPERFNNERFLGQLRRMKLSLLAIDEAHCISEWGHNFRPDYLKLAEIAREHRIERVLALTATATPSVVDDIRAAFEIAPEDAVVTGFYRENLELHLSPVDADARERALIDRIASRPPGPTIVYVTLQRTAERLADRLVRAGFPAEPYHAGLDDDLRAQVQERWMASDRGIVVATIAFGMGIDKADVRYVYHANVPKSLESYSQEIGRAGRDGKPSVCELLACADDLPTLESFVYGDTPTHSALFGLIRELVCLGPEFDVSLHELSGRYDIRPLVLRTVLTYLELDGVLKQGTPFYAGYQFRAVGGHNPASMAMALGANAHEVEKVYSVARPGRTWWSLDPEEAARRLGEDRWRIVRVLEILEERGLVELKATDVRHRFRRLRTADAERLAQSLSRRFEEREVQEVARLRSVVALVEASACQTNALAAYFGEVRETPCGHCTFCRTGETKRLPPPRDPGPIPEETREEIAALRRAHPEALVEPRQAARFLCGIHSPGTSRARLGRHILFGRLEGYPFADVLAWLDGSAYTTTANSSGAGASNRATASASIFDATG